MTFGLMSRGGSPVMIERTRPQVVTLPARTTPPPPDLVGPDAPANSEAPLALMTPMPRAEASVPTPASEPEVKPAPPPASPVPAAVPGNQPRRLNLNTATQAELELLPGVGPATAKKIIDFRTAKGGFRSVAQLDDVAGIGPKTMERLTPLLTVD